MPTTRRALSRRTLLGAALTAPLLAACGTTEAPVTAPATTGATTSGGDALTYTDSRGVTVTLDAPATRVVTLEWGPTEDVLSLGVTPVAVADPKGFATWVSSVTLPEGTPDVGLRTEPSLEAIAAAEPDLILGITGSIPENALAQAEQIAPVVLLSGGDATRPLDLLRSNLADTARLLGRETRGTELLATFDGTLAATATGLATASGPFVFAYLNVTGATVDLRMHGTRSVPGAVAEQLGLTNAFTDPGDDAWGIGSWDLESLAQLPEDTQFLYWANDLGDPIAALEGNALWQGLPFVQAGNVHPVANHVWVYGGPASMMQWAGDLAGVYA